MPKNQFTQADFEESVRQRWSADNLEVAIKLIAWNRKVNAEIEEKQKQEQEKLEQQKLKDLRQKELQKASSSSTNTEQSPTKATGAIPKSTKKQERNKERYEQYTQKKQDEEEKLFQEKLKKFGKQLNKSRAKFIFYHLNCFVNCYVKQTVDIQSGCSDRNKKIKLLFEEVEKYIQNYYSSLILCSLWDNNCINFNKGVVKKTNNVLDNCFFYSIDTAYSYDEVREKLIQHEIIVPGFKIPDIGSKCDVLDILTNDLYPNIEEYSKLIQDYPQNKTQFVQCVIKIQKCLEAIMEKNGYKAKVDKLIK
ncbi:MAG: hypothetical protein sL5_02630 [Candidatus Mesenet longicola]|uniref:Uncharacterized protein n=1 Tax=Candidatus Mesenet longicola TaxID=1892558 RepID=A0A8J3MNV1_9RICK|nr:MAG: hypothetical protein sGL2_02380 [Candidatus Mesenet longicola]GHM59270.1 MAG: hypothetical protein sL5_02630 [Candidatus Mesenet longicola]